MKAFCTGCASVAFSLWTSSCTIIISLAALFRERLMHSLISKEAARGKSDCSVRASSCEHLTWDEQHPLKMHNSIGTDLNLNVKTVCRIHPKLENNMRPNFRSKPTCRTHSFGTEISGKTVRLTHGQDRMDR